MVVDESQLENMKAETPPAADSVAVADPPPAASDPPTAEMSSEVRRLMGIHVPVIVQLAGRRMPISEVRKMSLGMIIEFYKSVDEPLQLLINNHPVGDGDAVKVGEHFGLRVTRIGDAAQRIKSMGA